MVALALIVRGDRTPRIVRHAQRHHRPLETSAPAAAAAAVTAPPATTAPALAATQANAETTVSPSPAVATAASPAPSVGPRLAIIIDDCGQWPDTEHGFIALPVAVTLSVLPNLRYSTQIAHDADAAGKGVMLHLPMEPRSGVDPGPGRVTTAMDDDAIAKQVAEDLAAVPLATGVNNHEGSRATADERVMRDVAAVLARHHVFFVDSRTGKDTVAQREAAAAGVPTARRDVFLDDVADVAATESELRRAAEIAKTKGTAIAIGHPRPTTLTAVRALLPELQRDGITLVLARDLVW